nr:hypothetical protein [Tanacetum cinerariifolium]
KITPLFPSMLTQAIVAEGEDSGIPTESQPTPFPTQPSAGDQPPLTESSLEHDTSQDPRVNLKGIGGSGGDQDDSAKLDAELDKDMEYIDTEEAVNEGRQSTVYTARLDVSTARPDDDTARPDVSTVRQELSATGPTTTPTTTTIFDDEEMTLADTLIKLKDDKAKGEQELITNFVPIGSEEDERMIRDMNKKAKEESSDKGVDNTKKRKAGSRMKRMSKRKKTDVDLEE